MRTFYAMCKLVFVPIKQMVVSKTFSVSFQLLSLQRLNLTPQIVALRAFQWIPSQISSSNCSIFLEYSSNFEFAILLFSSCCSSLFVLFSANVLVSLNLVPISYSLADWSFYFIVNISRNFSCTRWDFMDKFFKLAIVR